jgi:Mor family transcriptional regulator
MALSLKIDFPIQPFRIIKPDSHVLLVGSCFTENIGVLMQSGGINVNINPFGILFNPLCISNAILRITQKSFYTLDELYQNHEGRFVSFDHHGRFSGYEALEVLEKINSSIQNAHDFIKKVDCIVITLGSAWVYSLVNTNKVVANCHKVPAKEFSKSLLKVSVIYDTMKLMITELHKSYPQLNIVFTISPVKHLRDGVIENNQSKSTLVLACRQIMELQNEHVYYFPAYEIVTEELRDYRFYESDNAHPNALAINYIWEKFVEVCFNESAIQKVKDTQQLSKAMEHRSIHELGSRNAEIETKIKEYLKKHPIKE